MTEPNADDRRKRLTCPNSSVHGRCDRRGYVFKDECWVAKHIWKSPACRQKVGPEFWLPDCRDVYMYSLQSAKQHIEACEEKANERNLNGPWMKECNLTMELDRAHGSVHTMLRSSRARSARVSMGQTQVYVGVCTTETGADELDISSATTTTTAW